MSQKEMESKSTGSESELEVVECGEGWFKFQHRQTGNICTIMDTFAETSPTLEISPAIPFLCVFYARTENDGFEDSKPFSEFL